MQDWIQTYSGRRFWPLNPRAEDIHILDIAHALSMQCRFAGHCHFFYSVAEHCVRVSYLCPEEDMLSGLLHDASEAYLVDIPSPFKKSPEFSSYRTAEANLQALIYDTFNCPEKEALSVKKADLILLATEARDLMGTLQAGWEISAVPMAMEITPWDPNTARRIFLDRFTELNGKTLDS